MNKLQPCSKCRRHHRVESQRCPFCGSAPSALSLALPLLAVVSLSGCPSATGPEVRAVYAAPPPVDPPSAGEGDVPDAPPAEEGAESDEDEAVDDAAPDDGADAPDVPDGEDGPPVRAIYAAPPPIEN